MKITFIWSSGRPPGKWHTDSHNVQVGDLVVPQDASMGMEDCTGITDLPKHGWKSKESYLVLAQPQQLAGLQREQLQTFRGPIRTLSKREEQRGVGGGVFRSAKRNKHLYVYFRYNRNRNNRNTHRKANIEAKAEAKAGLRCASVNDNSL